MLLVPHSNNYVYGGRAKSADQAWRVLYTRTYSALALRPCMCQCGDIRTQLRMLCLLVPQQLVFSAGNHAPYTYPLFGGTQIGAPCTPIPSTEGRSHSLQTTTLKYEDRTSVHVHGQF